MKRKNAWLYYGQKLLLLIVSLFLLSILVFTIARLAPGDPLVSYYGSRVEKMSVAEKQAAMERLGLLDSIPVQYVRWIRQALQGNFGLSYKYKQDVITVIGDRIGNTLWLGGLGFLLLFLLCLALGLFCAHHADRWPDRLLCRLGTISSCIPEFWLSLLLILLFSVTLRWFPSSGAYSIGGDGSLGDRLWHLILPLTLVVLSHLWYYAYLVRNKLVEESRADYARLAKAKGLTDWQVLCRHCLRNVMPTYLSLMAISVPHILGGTYVIETVFSYPGLGTLSYESARYHDYHLLMLLCLLSGAVVIACNLLAQIIGERIDPRFRPAPLSDEKEVTSYDR